MQKLGSLLLSFELTVSAYILSRLSFNDVVIVVIVVVIAAARAHPKTFNIHCFAHEFALIHLGFPYEFHQLLYVL